VQPGACFLEKAAASVWKAGTGSANHLENRCPGIILVDDWTADRAMEMINVLFG
jgi:hypothetical protein